MDYSKIIKEIGRGKNHARDLDQTTAYELYKAMLAGQVPELELGGILIAFRIKGESEQEILGFYQAMQEQVMSLRAPQNRPLPVVIPSYNGARKQANLTPLLALLLARLGLPVVVHGVTEDSSRVTSAEIFQHLNIPWSHSATEAQQRLDDGLPVFIPVSALSAQLDDQLQQRWRMGVRNSSHTLAKLATPFVRDQALRLASVSHPEYMQKVGGFFQAISAPALLQQGTEGEVYANPLRCPPIHYIDNGEQQILLERQPEPAELALPSSKEAAITARWIEDCLASVVPIPDSIQKQLACCLVAVGRAETIEQARQQINDL
ncbi:MULTISPECIES: DNA-binding protein YbiB [Yersinia]|uniref:DNA-binding protein YbiB n=1 Tax=Yersinia rochesterensis TaxID=1604335 RepID=A0A8D4SRS8_9GAMM|nr:MULTISPECIES: DNA-binding protein YbiB [Yersinia]AJI88725.1 glycosyl transferase family, helical bundle domain protein [Yersinia frederiksenii Y225]CRY59569.1 glycosyl transferase family protein [Yersinia kristensenii]AIN16805.1 glycosyl transferase family, helical bundle domain protein [Yersinia rochesterensis]AJJ36298.1 glycosyl transferase family, helical bundle domain protein [Yersinia rochesterensis]AYD43520.1 DNA-binding protein YbiB [Yersinia rochesterensis]